MRNIREKAIVTNLLLLLVFIGSTWGVSWSIIEFGIIDQRYFTNQSNLLVMGVAFLYFLNQDDQKWFSYLSSIALINIVMTGAIYHLLLASGQLSFQSHLTHTIVPILYVVFYVVAIDNVPKVRQFWIMLFYPLVYFLFFLVTGPFTGFYPYHFMDVAQNGLLSVVSYTVFFLAPGVMVMSFILLYLKNTFERKYKG